MNSACASKHRFPRTELLERGEAVYEYWCNTCHGPEMLKPGTAALAIKYRGELPAALTERTDMVPSSWN